MQGDLAAEHDEPSRAPLPEGTIPVAVGLLISGVSSYAFFKVGQQALGKEDFKPIVALWFTMFALSPGFFIPLEQELGRALAHRRALGHGGRPVVARMLPLAGGLTASVSLVVLAAGPWATDDLFEGYWLVSFALIVAFVSYAPMHLARGICSGSGRFTAYGIVMAADGVVKIAGCVALWLLGIDTVESYALVVALSPWVGVVYVAWRGQLRTEEGPPATFSEITPNLGWLLGGSIVAAALVNAGPLAVDILADSTPGQQAQVTAFGNGVLLARVPLFLFQAVQAALLPRLARLAARGNLEVFREGFRRLMIIVVAVGALGTAGSALVGPQVLDLVYDGGLGRTSLTLLAAASALYMIATATAQAVIALAGHPWVTFGWIGGMSTFLVVTAVSADDIFLRVELGLVSGSAVALAVFVAGLRARVRAGAVPNVESVIDGVFDNTIEG